MTIQLDQAVVGQDIKFTPTISGWYAVEVRTTPNGGTLQSLGVVAYAGTQRGVTWRGTVPEGAGCVLTISLVAATDVVSKVLEEPAVPEPPDPEPPDTGEPPETDSYPASPDEVGVPDGVTLQAYTGPSVIETAGTVIDGKDITKSLYIRAPNVTVKRSRIKPASGTDYAVKQEGNSKGFVLEDCEIDGTNGRVDRAVLIYDNARISRCYLHGSRRFIYLAGGSYTTVEDCYVSDNVNTTDAHTSAVGSNGGVRHCKIQRNVLQTGKNTNASSALSLYPETNMGGAGDDIEIDGNLINTGGGYGVYLGHTPPESPHTNLRFTNNRFGTLYYANCGMYGPVASWSPNGAGNEWTNNRWLNQGNGGEAKDGQLVPEPSGNLRDVDPEPGF